MKQLMTVVEDQGYAMMPRETCQLVETVLCIVSTHPEVKEFIRDFILDHPQWDENAVINFLLLQAAAMNL